MKTRHARQIRLGLKVARMSYRGRIWAAPRLKPLEFRAFERLARRIERDR